MNVTDPKLHGIMTGADVEATDNHGRKPLHVAAKCGHVDVARLLLDRGMGWYWCDGALTLAIMQGMVCTGHDPADSTHCTDRRGCGGNGRQRTDASARGGSAGPRGRRPAAAGQGYGLVLVRCCPDIGHHARVMCTGHDPADTMLHGQARMWRQRRMVDGSRYVAVCI
jgi:hypothetical protein